MAHWVNAKDGGFDTRKDWSTRRVPVYNAKHKDDAILDAVGGAYTVTVTKSENVASLQTASNATLAFADKSGAIFTVNKGTGAGANAGTIKIRSESALAFEGGTINNTGLISLEAKTGVAVFNAKGDVTLQGGGAVVMGDNLLNVIEDGFSGTTGTLTNVDNTISGAGAIGIGPSSGGTLTVINGAAGVIEATGANNALLVSTPGVTMVNDGLLLATGAAGLTIAGTVVDGSGGGEIRAGKGSIVRLSDADIVGGTLATNGTGTILVSGQSAFDGQASAIHNQAKVSIADGAVLGVRGAIDNSGTISLRGDNAGSSIGLAGDLTLTGGGVVSLGDYDLNSISGHAATDTLTNVDNTITGDGVLGMGQLTLVNQAAGTILETGTRELIINTGAGSITNAGLIEATGIGGLALQGPVTNTGVIENAGPGTIEIDTPIANKGSLVVDGGTLVAFGDVTGNGSATIRNGTLKFAGAFNQNVRFTSQSGILELAQSQSYTRTVTGIAIHGGGDILDLDDIAFVGDSQANYVDNGSRTGGVLTVSDGTHIANIKLSGDYTAFTFGSISDGHGGVDVFYKETAVAAPPPAATSRLVAAMAGFGAGAGGPAHVAADARFARPVMLAVPRMAMA
ncbi:MAG: hypothetical protein H0X27_05255 [Caulobacteraceae bacterium]|nr:hypothetical protein [Caulobacteraceae bacterium]